MLVAGNVVLGVQWRGAYIEEQNMVALVHPWLW